MVAIVDCPTCGTKVEWTESNKFRPFCSERCKQIDLGCWASDSYRIPVQEEDNDPGVDPDPTSRA